MKKIRLLLVTIFTISMPCFSLNLAQGSEISATVLKSLENTSRFPQTKLTSCSDISGSAHFQALDLSYLNGDLTVTGADAFGHRFSAVKATNISGCEIWTADLDGNGTLDLIIFTPGEDSSGGYDNMLSILLFGNDGKPMPWQATGHFTTDANGVRQIIKTEIPGRAAVIVPTEEGLTGPDANLSFQLYQFAPSSVSKINGKRHGLEWPVFENSTAALVKHQQAEDLSFDLSFNTHSARLRGRSSPHITATSLLNLDDGTQITPPAVIVEETQNQDRSIIFDPVPSDIEKVVAQRLQVSTMGSSCEEEECRPFIMIAKP